MIEVNDLSLLLGKTKKAREIAFTIACKYTSYRELFEAPLTQLSALVPQEYVNKILALERVLAASSVVPLPCGKALDSSNIVFQHFYSVLKDEKREHFYTVLLDTKHRIIREDLISVGSLNLCIVHPREVFKEAVKESANSLILVHNHPSGNPSPSQEDYQITKRLSSCGRMLGIEILDHLIIGANCYYSFREQGNLE